jgi:serine/threonine-protein kinase
MATVYLAHDLKHDRRVALKVLEPSVAATLGPERFLREIQVTARLDHPNIVPVFDSGEDGGRLWYTMPYVRGETLREQLQREGPLAVEDALRYAREVAEALDCAHRQGIIHRDIKPENVLLADGHARVADFGVARAIEVAAGRGLTQTGLAVGTPAYMSPEQAMGGPVDARSDVYALGCVLYEMLAGEPPYTGPTAQAVIAKRLSEPVPHVGTLRQVPPRIEAAVSRALARNPADRFAGAGEFAAALGAESASPRPSSRVSTRRRELILAAGALLLAAATGYAVLHRRGGGPAAGRPGETSRTAGYAASIAILPFVTVGNDSSAEYFSEGMTDEIITQLAQIPGLKVISRISAVALKDRHLTLPQIAETLGVQHVVEGTMRRSGDSIRVNVQLMDARRDEHLWAASYDRPLRAVFGLQEEIAREVSSRLLGPGEQPRPRGSGSRAGQTGAYDAYLEGKYWLQRRTPEGFERALELLERAIREDSSFAPAYASLSSLYSLCIAHLGCSSSIEPDTGMRRAISLADRAVNLDPGLADGYAARGYAEVALYGLKDVALADLEHSLQLRPNSGEFRVWYAIALASVGRFAEAMAAARTAADLDPLAPAVHTGYAGAAIIAQRYDLALTESRRAERLEPTMLTPLRWSALALLLMGRPEECAVPAYRRATPLWAACLRAVGRGREAATVMDSLERAWRPRTYAIATDIAKYHALGGDAAGAAKWLERSRNIQNWLLPSAIFDRVRDAPEFRQAIERMDQWHRAEFDLARWRQPRPQD